MRHRLLIPFALMSTLACGRVVTLNEDGNSDGGPGPIKLDGGSDGGSPSSPCPDAGAVVAAVLGASCTRGSTSASNQPENPCAAGYIWSCDDRTGAWIQASIRCNAGPSTGTLSTAPCAPGNVLFVAEYVGYCAASLLKITGNTVCPMGTYEYDPECCVSTQEAYCVPLPAQCNGELSCGCAISICTDQPMWPNSFGSSNAEAAGGVIDCLFW